MTRNVMTRRHDTPATHRRTCTMSTSTALRPHRAPHPLRRPRPPRPARPAGRGRRSATAAAPCSPGSASSALAVAAVDDARRRRSRPTTPRPARTPSRPSSCSPAAFPAQSGDTVDVVVHSDAAVTSPASKADGHRGPRPSSARRRTWPASPTRSPTPGSISADGHTLRRPRAPRRREPQRHAGQADSKHLLDIADAGLDRRPRRSRSAASRSSRPSRARSAPRASASPPPRSSCC